MSTFRSSLALLTAARLAAGCSNPDPAAPTGPAVPMPQIQASIDNSTPDAAQRGMANKTWLWAGNGPAQIHYSTADGRDFAWVVGQRRIFAGEWQVNTAPGASGQSMPDLLRYPGVRLSGLSPDWSCRPAGTMFYEMAEREAVTRCASRPHHCAVRARKDAGQPRRGSGASQELDQGVYDAEACEQAERHDHGGEKTDRHDQRREQRSKQQPQGPDREGAQRVRCEGSEVEGPPARGLSAHGTETRQALGCGRCPSQRQAAPVGDGATSRRRSGDEQVGKGFAAGRRIRRTDPLQGLGEGFRIWPKLHGAGIGTVAAVAP